jgi:hypothetical protein
MGPYAQIGLPVPIYEAWDRLFSPNGLKYWLLAAHGSMTPGQTSPIFLGDASGMVDMDVREVIQPGESAPSFLPYVTFSLKRPIWGSQIGGRLWIEPDSEANRSQIRRTREAQTLLSELQTTDGRAYC